LAAHFIDIKPARENHCYQWSGSKNRINARNLLILWLRGTAMQQPRYSCRSRSICSKRNPVMRRLNSQCDRIGYRMVAKMTSVLDISAAIALSRMLRVQRFILALGMIVLLPFFVTLQRDWLLAFLGAALLFAFLRFPHRFLTFAWMFVLVAAALASVGWCCRGWCVTSQAPISIPASCCILGRSCSGVTGCGSVFSRPTSSRVPSLPHRHLMSCLDSVRLGYLADGGL